MAKQSVGEQAFFVPSQDEVSYLQACVAAGGKYSYQHPTNEFDSKTIVGDAYGHQRELHMDYMVSGCLQDLVYAHLSTIHRARFSEQTFADLVNSGSPQSSDLQQIVNRTLCDDFQGDTSIERVYNFALFARQSTGPEYTAVDGNNFVFNSAYRTRVRLGCARNDHLLTYQPHEIVDLGNLGRAMRSDWLLQVSREARVLTLAAFHRMGLPMSWVPTCSDHGWQPSYNERHPLPTTLQERLDVARPVWFKQLIRQSCLASLPHCAEFIWFIVLMDKINECNDRWLNIYYGDWHGEYGVYLPAIPTSRQEWRDMKNNAAWGDCASQASEIGTRQLLRSADEVGTGNADIQVALREACSLVPLHHMLAMLQGLWGNSNVRSRWKKGEHGMTAPIQSVQDTSPADMLWHDARGRLQDVWLDAERWGLSTVGCGCTPCSGCLNYDLNGGPDAAVYLVSRLNPGRAGVGGEWRQRSFGDYHRGAVNPGRSTVKEMIRYTDHCFGGHMPMFYPPGYDDKSSCIIGEDGDWGQTADAKQDWKFQGVRGGDGVNLDARKKRLRWRWTHNLPEPGYEQEKRRQDLHKGEPIVIELD
jgi:hypothetical protein